jgi:hypothetical protein
MVEHEELGDLYGFHDTYIPGIFYGRIGMGILISITCMITLQRANRICFTRFVLRSAGELCFHNHIISPVNTHVDANVVFSAFLLVCLRL